jgi:hypothetical protein
MGEESTCKRCGGAVAPTGGRSRSGFHLDPHGADIAWHAWRETGVCSACGAVHRRVADVAGAAWDFLGTVVGQPGAFDFPEPAGAPRPIAFEATLSIGRKTAAVAPHPAPVDGPPLHLRWNVDGESSDDLDGLDYATLALFIATFLGVTAQSGDPQHGFIACMALYLVLSWPPTRRALRVLLHDMQGRD